MWPTFADIGAYKPHYGGRFLPNRCVRRYRRKSEKTRLQETKSAQGQNLFAIQRQVGSITIEQLSFKRILVFLL